MVYNRAQLKRDVRLSMKGATPKPMLVALLFTVVVGAGTWLINTVLGWLLTGGVSSISDTAQYYILQGYDVEYAAQAAVLDLLRMGLGALFGAIVGGAVLSLIVYLWESAMGVGFEDYCLSMVRNENPPMGKIFGALPMFGEVLVTRVLTGVFELLWALLMVVGYTVVVVIVAIIDMPLITVLLIIASTVGLILGIIWVTMRYALVDYVLLDKGLSGMDAIRESKRLMQDNIGRGFVLQLSFAGWYFLILAIIYGAAIAVLMLFGAGLHSIGPDSVEGLVTASGTALLILAAASIAVIVLMLWLRPYTTGCWAKFYDWAKGAADGVHSGPGCGGAGGWDQPGSYTWTSGPSSGTGTGSTPGSGGGLPPRPPKSPRDDPWN